MDTPPNFDDFYVLSTDRLQLSSRINHPIGLLFLETSNLLRCLTVRLYRLL